MYLVIFNIYSLPGLRVRGGGEKLHQRGQDSAQLSQRGHHPAAACGWVGSWWESKKFLCFLHLWAIFAVLVPAALLLTWRASLWIRQTLRLHREKESDASGGTEEGHFWVWWVCQGCSVCVCLSVLSNILLWYIAPYFHFFVLLFSDVCFRKRFSLRMLVLRWLTLLLVESRLALRGCVWQIRSLPQRVRPSSGSPGLPGSPAWPRGASGQTRAGGCVCGHRCGHGVLRSRPWARPFHRGEASKALFWHPRETAKLSMTEWNYNPV